VVLHFAVISWECKVGNGTIASPTAPPTPSNSNASTASVFVQQTPSSLLNNSSSSNKPVKIVPAHNHSPRNTAGGCSNINKSSSSLKSPSNWPRQGFSSTDVIASSLNKSKSSSQQDFDEDNGGFLDHRLLPPALVNFKMLYKILIWCCEM